MKYFLGFTMKLILWCIMIPAVILAMVLLIPVLICFATVGILEDMKDAINRWSDDD